MMVLEADHDAAATLGSSLPHPAPESTTHVEIDPGSPRHHPEQSNVPHSLAVAAVAQGRARFFTEIAIAAVISAMCALIINILFGMPFPDDGTDSADYHPLVRGFTRFAAAVTADTSNTLTAVSLIAVIGVAATVARSERDRELTSLDEDISLKLSHGTPSNDDSSQHSSMASRIIELRSSAIWLYGFSVATAGLSFAISVALILTKTSAIGGLASIAVYLFLILESGKSRQTASFATESLALHDSARSQSRISELAATPNTETRARAFWVTSLLLTSLVQWAGIAVSTCDLRVASVHAGITSIMVLLSVMAIDSVCRTAPLATTFDSIGNVFAGFSVSLIPAVVIIALTSLQDPEYPILAVPIGILTATSFTSLAVLRAVGHGGHGPLRGLAVATLRIASATVPETSKAQHTRPVAGAAFSTISAIAIVSLIAALPLLATAQIIDAARVTIFATTAIIALLPGLYARREHWPLAVAPAAVVVMRIVAVVTDSEGYATPTAIIAGVLWLAIWWLLATGSRTRALRTLLPLLHALPNTLRFSQSQKIHSLFESRGISVILPFADSITNDDQLKTTAMGTRSEYAVKERRPRHILTQNYDEALREEPE